MLGSSIACRIFNDCHSPSSYFSFRGADRLTVLAHWANTAYQSTESAQYKTVLVCNPASIHAELFFFAPGTAIRRGFFTAFAMQAIQPSSQCCSLGNEILWICLFFAALTKSILDWIPVNWGWIVVTFAWCSSPLSHPVSSRSVSHRLRYHAFKSDWFWQHNVLSLAVPGFYRLRTISTCSVSEEKHNAQEL